MTKPGDGYFMTAGPISPLLEEDPRPPSWIALNGHPRHPWPTRNGLPEHKPYRRRDESARDAEVAAFVAYAKRRAAAKHGREGDQEPTS